MFKTYSFADVDVTVSHPNVGNYTLNGEGIGSIGVNMANDRTSHDVAADGTVMVSKIKTRNGSIPLSVQQTSSIHRWLLKWANYLEASPASEYAKTVLIVRSKSTGETTTCHGVTPQKISDKVYQAQGQNVSWNLMAADIQNDLV